MKMYTQFVFQVGDVWKSVVWLTLRSCASLHQFRYKCFLDIGEMMLQLVQHLILLRTLLYMQSILWMDLIGAVNVLIVQLLRRVQRKSPEGYNNEVLKINTHLQQLTIGLCHIHFLRHRGFWADLPHLRRDGFHLCVEKNMQIPQHKWWST